VSYMFLLAVQCLFYGITQSAFTANFLNCVLMFAMGYSTELLGRVNGKPLIPSDLLLIKNAKDIASFAEVPFVWSGVGGLAVIAISLIIHFVICRKQKKNLTFKKRLTLTLTSLLFFVIVIQALCINTWFRYRILPKMEVQISAFNPIEDYQANGLVLTFFPRIGDLIVEEAEGYGELAINAMKYKYESLQFPETPKKPNVIIIQNEAFWDPTLLPEVTYSEDLLSGIHSLNRNTVTGSFLTPVFGGGTCLPEFETLTGISTYFLSASAYPYTQYITDETPSIVQAYRDNGYQTVAIHPYKRNFYNRSTAYPLLGFDDFISIEKMDYRNASGTYIDDLSCVKQIIHEYENKTADRIFQFVVTMENHGTYKTPRYESFDFEMEAPTLSEEDYMDLKRYSQGVYNADKAFLELVNYFKTADEPVIIAMYGDHLPLLGTNGSTYRDASYIEPTETFVSYEHPQLYETPYVVWSNYSRPDLRLKPKISGHTLGVRLFLATGCEAPWYFGVLNEFVSRYPAVANA
ncbi:MAG: LTA synthase family protein, partial [Clostridia bacterium]|nr:LTA synthase family protein [Clostridia bacterium]